MKAIITFLLIFCVIVVFHEIGHFFFAKRSGFLVREFAIGMGPKIFAHTGLLYHFVYLLASPFLSFFRFSGRKKRNVR